MFQSRCRHSGIFGRCKARSQRPLQGLRVHLTICLLPTHNESNVSLKKQSITALISDRLPPREPSLPITTHLPNGPRSLVTPRIPAFDPCRSRCPVRTAIDGPQLSTPCCPGAQVPRCPGVRSSALRFDRGPSTLTFTFTQRLGHPFLIWLHAARLMPVVCPEKRARW